MKTHIVSKMTDCSHNFMQLAIMACEGKKENLFLIQKYKNQNFTFTKSLNRGDTKWCFWSLGSALTLLSTIYNYSIDNHNNYHT